ncbi:MAG: hypothetical protein V3V99_08470 [candidate division Zixibacteria bacterium]
MDFGIINALIANAIIKKIKGNFGLSIFARERAKFEGWLKVEIIDSLGVNFNSVVPEKNRIDVCFEDWAIELKTINTNYGYENVKNKNRPITKNIEGILADIDKLKRIKTKNKAVVFIVFPCTADNKKWKNHLAKIKPDLRDLIETEFCFKNKIPGVLYFGLV